jgi:hypothetical protein
MIFSGSMTTPVRMLSQADMEHHFLISSDFKAIISFRS